MLWAIIVILLALWALGFGLGTAGNFIHLLLAASVIVFIIQLLNGRESYNPEQAND